MGKTSKLFLESEIKRILNLNDKIERNIFIKESLDSNTEKNLSEISTFLGGKIDDDLFNDIINLLTQEFDSTRCGGNGSSCEDFSKYILTRLQKEIKTIKSKDDFNEFYNPIKNAEPEKLKDEVFKYLGKKRRVRLTDEKAEELINQMRQVKDILLFTLKASNHKDLEVRFSNFKRRLMNGDWQAENCPACKTPEELYSEFEEYIQVKLINNKISLVPKAELEDYLENIKHDTELLKRFGKVDFLSKKIDDLLDIGQTKSSDDTDKTIVRLSTLIEYWKKEIPLKIYITPSSIMKNKMAEKGTDTSSFIEKSKYLSGRISTVNKSAKYIEFLAYGSEVGVPTNYKFVFWFNEDGLSYPETYNVGVRHKPTGSKEWENLLESKVPLKILNITKKSQ